MIKYHRYLLSLLIKGACGDLRLGYVLGDLEIGGWDLRQEASSLGTVVENRGTGTEFDTSHV